MSSHSPNRSSIPNARFARQASVDRLRQEKKKWRHSFPSGFPDPRLFPIPELKSELHTALRSRDVLRYEDPGGNPFFVEQVTTYLRRIRNVTGREIVVTHGSQEALFLLAQVLIKPGDWVGVEALGYPPAHAVFRYAGARLEPISIDREGLSVEHLVSVLKRKRIRFLYLTPLHQYPTTVTLSQERRLRLIKSRATMTSRYWKMIMITNSITSVSLPRLPVRTRTGGYVCFNSFENIVPIGPSRLHGRAPADS